jgi:exonuclease VII small subunit
MADSIVVVFRMPPGGMTPGPEGAYLTRARSMCARGEALGGRLVAWSAALVGVAWDTDSLEEAMLLVTSIREEALTPARAWACGLAEGELEPLAPDGGRMHLAWGDALLRAASLARIARSGEVLIDGDVRALRAGQLSLVGARAATDSGQRVRGWKLDLEHPWKRAAPFLPHVTDQLPAVTLDVSGDPHAALESSPTLEMQALQFIGDELSTAEVLQIVDSTGPAEAVAPPESRRQGSPLAAHVRSLENGEDSLEAVEALAHLRRARADAESAPPVARCQAALALAMALTLAGRAEEGLLEALDALARAREAREPKAVGACMALLAKLYAGAGRPGEAAALRESAGVA